MSRLIGADPREIVWTSGATESNNLAQGRGAVHKTRGKHIVTVKTEHKAVLDRARARAPGLRGHLFDVQEDGLLDLGWKFKAALRPDTILVSVMHVNNEIGVIQDIAAIGEICRERGIVFHVDAAQATGKVAIDPPRCRST